MGRLFGIVLLAMTAGSLCSGCSYAQTVSMTIVQDLSFPTIAIPQSGSTSLAVSSLNSSTSGTATVLYGTASRAQFDLSMSEEGGPAVAISVDISGVTVSDPNVTLTNFTGLYGTTQISSFPSSTLQLPSVTPAFTPLYVGATITANHSVTPSTCTASYVVTLTVQ